MSRPPAVAILVLLLAGCNAGGPPGAPPAIGAGPPPVEAPGPVAAQKIAVLLPLSGPIAPLGQSMLDAIRLAFATEPGRLDVHDTHGTEAGAAAAAALVTGGQDAIVLGPLTATETRAVAAVTVPAGVPVLSYSSDPSVSQPGVWVLGLTVDQQVSRLVGAARADGRTRLAAFLPQTPFGDAMAAAYAGDAAADGLAPPDIRRHDESFASINDGLKSLSDINRRRADIDAKLQADRASTDPAAQVEALTLAAAPVPPPPFDALLLADTGTGLQEILDEFGSYHLQAAQIRVMGPALWGKFARKLGRIAGAWYAAPDPQAAVGFRRQFEARYGHAPNPLDDVAYDSGALAARLSAGEGFSVASLTRPDGFAGTDGVFALAPDGHVSRGLAIFQIDEGGGSHVVSPAPSRLGGGA